MEIRKKNINYIQINQEKLSKAIEKSEKDSNIFINIFGNF